jgi:hypothetical protein
VNIRIDDLGPLRALPDLRQLSRYATNPHRTIEHPLRDLSPVADLPGLEVLELARSRVEDLNPLRGLAHLRRLDLSRARVTDLSPLAGLQELEWLKLNSTPVADLRPLASLERLEYLDVSNTADLSPLAGLRMLRPLVVRDTPVTTLMDVSDLPAVSDAAELDLTSTQVADLSWIGRAAALRELRLRGAPAAGRAEARASGARRHGHRLRPNLSWR